MNCFRFLDFKSFDEVDRLTIPEYMLLMEAARLKQIDLDYRTHLLAWLTFKAKARKGKSQKPVFNKFEKFYDYRKELDKAMKKEAKESRFSGIGKLLKKGG